MSLERPKIMAFDPIKIELSSSPEVAAVTPPPVKVRIPSPIDPRDPECFHRRCSGINKKTKQRCNAVIGKKTEQSCHPTLLPTCKAHRDQESLAGWCQYQHPEGERCGRLFRWRSPYFELCSEHQGHPDTPCYFLRLPLEIRHEVFRYLLPARPIGSSTAALHDGRAGAYCHRDHPNRPVFIRHQPANNSLNVESVFPVPIIDLFLVSRQIYYEVKDLLFSTVLFIIDVRKDGTFMCGRRLLEPRRADGSSHYLVDEADEAKQRFLKQFDFSAVKQYAVDILVENWADQALYPNHTAWDEEVEIYDIRDYTSVVVSGILAKARNLCRLQVRLCLADFDWPHEQILANTKLILGPFERLRNVRQPLIRGIFTGKHVHNSMLTIERSNGTSSSKAPLCSVPPLLDHTPVIVPGMSDFDAYNADWVRWMSSSNALPVTSKPPIRIMFTEFKEFYSKLSNAVPDVMYQSGRFAFLHRARVARENEDVESFRHLRNELIQYWYAYLEKEERKKNDMNARLTRMLDTDIYPSHEWEDPSRSTLGRACEKQKNIHSLKYPVQDALAKQGVPLNGNARQQSSSLVSPDLEVQMEWGKGEGFMTHSQFSSIDPVDVDCFAHVGLSSEWYANGGEAGPSTKKRRVDSGFSEMTVEEAADTNTNQEDGVVYTAYVGKGKGKLGEVEVICLD